MDNDGQKASTKLRNNGNGLQNLWTAMDNGGQRLSAELRNDVHWLRHFGTTRLLYILEL